MAAPRERAPGGSRTLWLITVVVGLAGAALTVSAWGDLQARDAYPNLISGLAGILYASLGALILRRERNLIGKAVVPMTVEPDGVGRYPREVEAAVYFCALEAVQNVAKYADAGSAAVRLAERDRALVFEIEDDGRGFDTTTTTHGSGLQGMADRLDAIGGRLDVESAPGRGTLVRGRIPLP